MQPTVEEQLSGTCRILQEVVAPAVTAAYASDILAALISNLRMLTAALPELPAFLAWDNAESARLLDMMTDGPLLVRDADPAQGAALADLNARNEALREKLAEAIRSDQLPTTVLLALEEHFLERAARNPIKFAITLPAASGSK